MPDFWMDVDTALSEVPVNIFPLTDDTDFKSREESVTYDQAGMDLVWNFVTTAGALTQTAVTPTTAGDYDWTNQGNAMYTIEITASGGASINNDTEGFGWFVGFATGVLPWRGPTIGLRAAALNNALIDGGDVLDVNLTEMGGSSQSATDLKDFADAGYDPASNKVQGVVLVDTTTTNTDVRGTDGANTVVPMTAALSQTEHDATQSTLAGLNDVAATDIVSAGAITTLAGAVVNVDLVDTTTTNTDVRGTDNAATEAKQDIIDTNVDSVLTDTNELQAVLSAGIDAETQNDTLIERLKIINATVESLRPSHTGQPIGEIFMVDPVNGDTHANGNRGGVTDPYLTIQDCHDNAVTDSNHDVILLIAGAAAGVTTHTIAGTTTISKRYTFIRGPGRDFVITRTGNGDTLAVTADGVELSGFQLETAATGSGDGIQATDADFLQVRDCWVNNTQGDGINILRGENCQIRCNVFTDTGQGGSGEGIHIRGTAGSSNRNHIEQNVFHACAGDAVLIEDGTTNQTYIHHNTFEGNAGYGVNVGASSTDAFLADNHYGGNVSGDVNDAGTDTIRTNDEEWAKHSIATEVRLAELDAANLPTDIANLNDFDPAVDVVANVTLVDTTTTNTDMRGTDSANTVVPMTAATSQTEHDATQTTLAGFNDIAATDIVSNGAITTLTGAVVNVDLVDTVTTNTDVRGTDNAATEAKQDIIDTNVDAILVDTGTTIPALIAALNDISVADLLTTAMTESYAAEGVAPTLTQAVMEALQFLKEKAVSSTTVTVKKLDQSTTAATYTLDDGTTPTSITRAT